MPKPAFQRSARRLMSRGQVVLGTLAMLGAFGLIWEKGFVLLLQIVCAAITLFYVLFVGMKLVVNAAAPRTEKFLRHLDALTPLSDHDLPVYTVFVPMYGEGKGVVEGIIKAIANQNYPADKVQVLLLVEHKDATTTSAILQLEDEGKLPDNCQLVIVPDLRKMTNKPQACSYAFKYAIGTRAVIFDAEDRPERNQLRKAATAFDMLPPQVGCLQAELAFWNPRLSRISTFYQVEYGIHFSKMLRGLAALKLIPPLGGTSNHFRMEALKRVTSNNGTWRVVRESDNESNAFKGPWDIFNLTEDADLAGRLVAAGFRIMMLNSVTYEEAPKGMMTSTKQRSRWLQGFSQTYFTWTRHPITTMRDLGLVRWMFYILLMGGTPLSIILNPITWGTTITYFVAKYTDNEPAMNFIDQLFTTPVYMAGMFVAIVGNMVLWIQKIWTPIHRQEIFESLTSEQRENLGWHGNNLATEEYGLIKRLLFTPLWWAFTSLAGYLALFKIVTGNQKWLKTPHGHALNEEA